MVIECANGTDLMARITQVSGPAAVLLDLNMPEMNGIEVLNYLAEMQSDVSIVITSGGHPTTTLAAQYASEEHQLNVSGVLRKPISVDVLAESLRNLIV